MKISKIDNQRFARDNRNGYLYVDNVERKTVLRTHIKKRIDEAHENFDKMFSVFKLVDISDDAKQFNYFLKETAKSFEDNLSYSKINDCFKKITKSDYRNLKNQYAQFLKWPKDAERPLDINKEKLNIIIKLIRCKYKKDINRIAESIDKNTININPKAFKWLQTYFANDNVNFIKKINEKVQKIVNCTSVANKSSLYVLVGENQWNDDVWHKCYEFAANSGYKSNESNCCDTVAKYENSIIFDCIKKALIDLKPGRIEKRYKDSAHQTIDEIKKKLVAKTMGCFKNYVCGLTIRIGKQKFLCNKYADFIENNCDKISSLFYELQKADDEINVRTNSAIAFATLWVNKLIQPQNGNNQSEFLDLNGKKNNLFKYQNYFLDTFMSLNQQISTSIIEDIVNILYAIRNNIFHFDVKKINDVNGVVGNYEKLESVIIEEISNYSKVVQQKILSNCCNLYYEHKDLQNLFSEDYVLFENVAYMPGFSNILKLMQRNGDIIPDDGSRKNAMIFVMKTIYQKHYLRECVKNKKFDYSVMTEFKKKNVYAKNEQAKKAFLDLLDSFENKEIWNIARKLLEKVSLDNNKEKEHTKDRFLKIMLDELVMDDFIAYTKSHFNFVFLQSSFELNQTNDFSVSIPAIQFIDLDLAFYFLGRIIPNRLTNELANAYAKYFYFLSDVTERYSVNKKIKDYVNLKKQSIDRIKLSLNLAIEFTDFEYTYEEHSSTSKKYEDMFDKLIDVNKSNDNYREIYLQKDNFVNYKGIQEANKYGFAKVLEGIENKISENDLKDYINNRNNKAKYISIYDKIRKAKSSDANANVNREEWKDLNKYIANKNLVEFNEAYSYFCLFVDLQQILLSYTYKRERDIFYFLLGIKCLSLEDNNFSNDFYREIFDLFIYDQSNKKTVNSKINDYLKQNSVIKRFYDIFFTHNKQSNLIRNSIDHFDMFKAISSNKSVIEIFSETYANLLIYDRKLQKNLMPKMQSLFEKYGINITNKNNILHFRKQDDRMTIELAIPCQVNDEKLRIKRLLKLSTIQGIKKQTTLKAYDKSSNYALNAIKLMTK